MTFLKSQSIMDGGEAALSPSRSDKSEAAFQLPFEMIERLLAKHDEGCDPDRICFYPNIDSMAALQRQNKNWAQGEIFIHARSLDRFVIMKQIAPSSCEFMTITHKGFKDVLTAYRFPQEELVAVLSLYLTQD